MTRRTRSTALIALAACAAPRRTQLRLERLGTDQGHSDAAVVISSSRAPPTRRRWTRRGAFDNESIWVFQQIIRVALHGHARRQEREAVAGHELRPVARQADVHVPPAQGRQVPQRPADDVRRRQVLDRRRAQPQDRLGLHRRRRSRASTRPGPVHGRRQDQVPVGAVPRRHRALHQRDHPQELRRQDARRRSTSTRSAPARSCGTLDAGQGDQAVKRNPNYWQKGKPYLDSVTWTYVADDNTRELQLKGGQIADRRVPAVQLRSSS